MADETLDSQESISTVKLGEEKEQLEAPSRVKVTESDGIHMEGMNGHKHQSDWPDRASKRVKMTPETEVPMQSQQVPPEVSAFTKAKMEGEAELEALQTDQSEAPSKDENGEKGYMDSANGHEHQVEWGERASKRVRVSSDAPKIDSRDKVKGVAPVKEEYLVAAATRVGTGRIDDDAAEARPRDSRDNQDQREGNSKKRKSKGGQNTGRQFGSWFDSIKLCNSRATSSEFSPKECKFGERCTLGHDLREYLSEGKREDLTTFSGKCPVWEANGKCHAGWKCRFVSSHSKEITHEDGRKELVLIEDSERVGDSKYDEDENRVGVYNVVTTEQKLDLSKRQTPLIKAERYSAWLDKDAKDVDKVSQERRGQTKEDQEENRAQFTDPPFLPSEKRRLYFGPETPVLAPLTTQGNLPYRRMCVDFGAQITYSEMAMTTPLIQGQKSEWALMKAHESEISPPRYTPSSIVQGYDNSKDLKFGAQVSASKPWQALKATEAMTQLLPHLRLIDLNCGCPIELVYRQGAGSALLDMPSRLEKIIRGMNAVSLDVPITAKIRMGTKDSKPTAQKLIDRLAFGGPDVASRLGAPGCAAITLHGRSRQQRYTKDANWKYISECAALIKSYHLQKDDLTDTIREPDARTLPNSPYGKLYFIGNGDCYSHVDYLDHIQNARVDSVMVARGALIKPWIFEEIESGQYLDKSSTERLSYIEKFCRYGLEAWGSDEVGVGQTRRFLLEWLSFAHRYVPVGLLDHLPPSLQDRPPAYRGRDDLETLLASNNYLDWLKLASESPLVAKLQYGMKITFIFILILFIDSVNRVYRVQVELAETNKNSNGRASVLGHERMEVQARKFYSQRNMYLCGFTLFLSLILNRTYTMILDVLRLEEKVKSYEGKKVAGGKESEKLANAGNAGEIGKLRKELEAKERDFQTLKKQSEGLSREYNELSDRYEKTQGVDSMPKKDR
ncbi:hypothetical protein B7494_g7760 [Chlorociboria aeruginascens]|nr:hypothetical protein B7494_g7760 [Chlorociboria aeruginascens]